MSFEFWYCFLLLSLHFIVHCFTPPLCTQLPPCFSALPWLVLLILVNPPFHLYLSLCLSAFAILCGPVFLWSASMFSCDLFNLLLLTPSLSCVSLHFWTMFWTNCLFWLSPNMVFILWIFTWMCTAQEVTIRGFARVVSTPRREFTLKTSPYVLVKTFLGWTEGMRQTSVWFWLFFMSNLRVPSMSLLVFSLEILVSSHCRQKRWSGISFFPSLCVSVNHVYSLWWRAFSGLPDLE